MVLEYKQMSSRPFPALFSDIQEFQGLLSRLQRPPDAITTGVTPKKAPTPHIILKRHFKQAFMTVSIEKNTVRELILQFLSDQGGFEMVTHLGKTRAEKPHLADNRGC